MRLSARCTTPTRPRAARGGRPSRPPSTTSASGCHVAGDAFAVDMFMCVRRAHGASAWLGSRHPAAARRWLAIRRPALDLIACDEIGEKSGGWRETFARKKVTAVCESSSRSSVRSPASSPATRQCWRRPWRCCSGSRRRAHFPRRAAHSTRAQSAPANAAPTPPRQAPLSRRAMSCSRAERGRLLQYADSACPTVS